MMESSNLNLDLHHQEDLSSSPSLPWNPQDLMLNSGDLMVSNGGLPSSRSLPMVQELGFPWSQAGHGESFYMMNSQLSLHQAPPYTPKSNNIKEELSAGSFAKLAGFNLQDFCLNQIHGLHPGVATGELGCEAADARGGYSVVMPSTSISCPSLQSLYPGSLGMELQALDLLASARFGRTVRHSPVDGAAALLREDLGYGHGQFQEPTPPPLVSNSYHHKVSPSANGGSDAKRANSLVDNATSQPAPAKKPRYESRSSFTPFKVRKEKLGDRIAALQQLVSPFGKTDTASVLMEATGYIKFLQEQVETLSVPYMRSSNNKRARASQPAASEEDQRDEQKPDLRSRGLCLVPLSCTSYVTNEHGGVWSPPNYR